jgi:type I restriction enzyme S subunit
VAEMMFYKETVFTETSIGKIPKDWKVARLEKIFNLKNGQRPKILETGKIPVYGANGIMGYTNEFLVDNDFTIVIGRVGASGEIHLGQGKTWVSDNAIYSESYDKSAIYPPFAYYLLKSKELSHFASKTTHPIITQTFLNHFPIQLPPLPEQQKIAEILSTVDEAIRKTDEVIAKTERLKKGLMQELLTRGIGHKEFKDTEIGRIPKEWDVVRLGDDKIAEIRGNKIIKDVEKVAFIPMELVPDQEIFAKYEIRDLNDVSSSTYCEAGDLLLAKITPSLENGKQGIVPDDVPNVFALATTEVYPIVCKGVNRLFLFYILKFPKFRKILEFSMRGTTGRQRVPKEAVEKLKIPLLPHEEQQKIAEVLYTVDKKLEIERNEKTKLERIKQGLMDLLLTGKIRVKVT